MIKILGLATLVAVFILSCTMTTTRIKSPVFSKSTDSLLADLNRIVSCQNISTTGQELNTNGLATSEFYIYITDGQNIPAADSAMTSLAKQIAIKFKNALRDKNEYQNYEVLFITKTEKGHLTTSAWKGKIFKLEEL